MNISNREKNMLIMALSVLIGVLYFQFGYGALTDNLDKKKQEKVAIETRYNKAMSDIQTLDDRKSNVKKITTKVTEKTATFYPEILQYKLITEVNKLIEDSGIKANLQFEELSVKAIEDLTPKPKYLPSGSTDSLVAAFDGKVLNNPGDNNNSTASTDSSASNNGVTCEQMRLNVNITSATYDQLKKFILSLENYDRRIFCSKTSIATTSETNITGTLALDFFAVPKINGADKDYFNWTYNNVYGSEGLFSKGAANGAYSKSAVEAGAKDTNDFVAFLKSPTSEFSTFRMGRANDKSTKSYIYEDKNDTIDVTLELTEKDGKFIYKYKAGNSVMPTSGNGTAFTPNGDKILFKIFSEKRLGTDDVAGIKLKVINNTTKAVDVLVDGDDSSNPRVSVTSEGGTVNVK
jgi:type IV pilus assembly protein PilO